MIQIIFSNLDSNDCFFIYLFAILKVECYTSEAVDTIFEVCDLFDN